MRTAHKMLIASVVLLVACHSAVNEEFRRLEGTWTVVTIDGKGPSAGSGGTILVITGRQIDTRGGLDGLKGATFTVDPTKTPKQIDVVFTPTQRSDVYVKDKLRYVPQPGIYELLGTELRLCLAKGRQEKVDKVGKRFLVVEVATDPRPTDFSPEAGSLIVLRR